MDSEFAISAKNNHMDSQLNSFRQNPDTLSIEALDAQITNLSIRMTTEEYAMLTLIRAFDERAGWLKWGRPVAPTGCTGAVISH